LGDLQYPNDCSAKEKEDFERAKTEAGLARTQELKCFNDTNAGFAGSGTPAVTLLNFDRGTPGLGFHRVKLIRH
jgi:hypothetical protein